VKPRVLIVDDELLARRRLQLALDEIGSVEVVGTASGCTTARRAIADLRPDIALVDIRMRDGSGLELIASVPPEAVPVTVFVTAFDEYATNAFDVAAVDYVLKPVEVARLTVAIERAQEKLASRDAAARIEELQSVVTALRGARGAPAERYHGEFWVRTATAGFVRVPVDQVDWVAAEGGGYVRLHAGARSYLQRGTIAGFHKKVDPARFIRVHRATLVRLDAIAAVERCGLGPPEVVLDSGQRLKAGRIHARHLRRLLAAQG